MEDGVHRQLAFNGSDAIREDDLRSTHHSRRIRSSCRFLSGRTRSSPIQRLKQSPFQRTFVNQVKRCGQMSRKIRFFKDQISKAGVSSPSHPSLQPDIELEELEVQLSVHETELIEMNSNSEKLRQSYNELLEFRIVLQKLYLLAAF